MREPSIIFTPFSHQNMHDLDPGELQFQNTTLDQVGNSPHHKPAPQPKKPRGPQSRNASWATRPHTGRHPRARYVSSGCGNPHTGAPACRVSQIWETLVRVPPPSKFHKIAWGTFTRGQHACIRVVIPGQGMFSRAEHSFVPIRSTPSGSDFSPGL